VISRAVIPALVLSCLAGEAGAVLPADVSARIAQAVDSGRAAARREAEQAARTGDPALAQMLAARARQYASNELCAVVVSAIGENPYLAEEIVATASEAAPELAPDVTRRVAAAFPYLGSQPMRAPPPPIQVAQERAPRPVAPEPVGPPPPSDVLPEVIYDPFEDFNRAVFEFNDVFDRFLLRPVAWVYGKVTPDPAKRSMRNFFRNLRSPARFANDLLQLAPEDAGTTLARFVVNSTFGVGGLFEVAEDWGLKHKPADFGQTLHRYGVQGGPYIIIPFIGPSTMRDAAGTLADTGFDGTTWLLDSPWNYVEFGTRVTVKREELIEPLDKLREGSVDFYAALRSAYYQDRAVELRKGAPAPARDLDKEFEQAE
jgi:phospholipid-binding lipoprotein MlaA